MFIPWLTSVQYCIILKSATVLLINDEQRYHLTETDDVWCVFECMPSEWREDALEHLLGAAFPWDGGSLCRGHHPAAPAGHADPGPPGTPVMRSTISLNECKACVDEDTEACTGWFLIVSHLCAEPAPQSDTLAGQSEKPPWLLDQHRPAQLPDERSGGSAPGYSPSQTCSTRNLTAEGIKLLLVIYSNWPLSHIFRDPACEELSHWLCLHLLQWSEEIRSLHSGAVAGRHVCGGLLRYGHGRWVRSRSCVGKDGGALTPGVLQHLYPRWETRCFPFFFPFRWWLDGDPAACWRLCELRPQLEGVQGRFRRPALGVLAGQRTHTWAEHPGRLQPPHPPGGLEQQAQTRPLPELQVTVMHQLAKKKNNPKTCTTSMYLLYNSLLFFLLQCGRRGASIPPPCVGLQRDGAGLFQLVPRQAGLQHPWQWQHLRRDLPRRLVVQPVLLRQPQWSLLQGKCTQTALQFILLKSRAFKHFLIPQGGHYTPKGRGPLGPDGIVWYSWKDSDYYSLRKVSMMIRPRSFRTRLSPWAHGWRWQSSSGRKQMTVSVESQPTRWPGSWRELRELKCSRNCGLVFFFLLYILKKTLYTVEFFLGHFSFSLLEESSSSFSTSILYLLVWYFDTHC